MYKRYTDEQAEKWREDYEKGAAMDDLAAATCYKNKFVSVATIRQAIIDAGGKIRTYSETVNLRLKKRAQEYKARHGE